MKSTTKTILLLIAALLGGGLVGCVSLPEDRTNWSAEQIAADAKDNKARILITRGLGLGYTFESIAATVDLDKLAGGGANASRDGTITITGAQPKPPAPPKATQALCDDIGQAFMLVGSALLRTPAEDAKCPKPALPGAAIDARDQAEIDAVKASAARGK